MLKLLRNWLQLGKPKRAARRVRLQLEALESRLAPATRVWTGGALLNDNWKDKDNWANDILPVAGDNLIFPDDIGSLDRTTNNDFPSDTLFNSITFNGAGFILNGNRIRLGLGVPLGEIVQNSPEVDVNTINFDITLTSNSRFNIVNRTLTIAGNLSGNFAVDKDGAGTLVYKGDNTYTGDTEVNEGAMNLESPGGAIAIRGELDVGDGDGPVVFVRVQSDGQIFDLSEVRVRSEGNLTFNASDTIGFLRMQGGSIDVNGAAVLSLNDEVQVNNDSTIEGNVALVGNVSFDVGLGDELDIDGAISDGGLTGGVTKTGQGILKFSGGDDTDNTYGGATLVQEGILILNKDNETAIPEDLIIGGLNGNPEAAVVLLFRDNQLTSNTVTIQRTGLLDLNNNDDSIGALVMNGGSVDTGSGTLTIRSLTSNPSLFPATISGRLAPNGGSGFGGLNDVVFNIAGAANDPNKIILDISADLVGGGLAEFSVQKNGAGKLVLGGNSTFARDIVINAGAVLVNGSLPGEVIVAGGLLGGTGNVETVTVNSGTFSPGQSPGAFSAQTVNLAGAAAFVVELNGLIPGVEHDQLANEGDVVDVTLGDGVAGPFPTLDLRLGFNPAIGDQFSIIRDIDPPGIVGLFKDTQGNTLQEGSLFTVAGETFRIQYGVGNQVVLSVVDVATPLVAKKTQGRLNLTGDNDSESILIELAPGGVANTVQVTGITTQIKNGAVISFGPHLFTGIKKGIRVKMKGGNDRVEVVGGPIPGVIRLDGGDGDDNFVIGAANANFNVVDSAGNDQVGFSLAQAGVQLDVTKNKGQVQNVDAGGNTLSIRGNIEIIVGTEFDDFIVGTSQNSIIVGLAGNDVLIGGSGKDLIIGGVGEDSLFGLNGDRDLLIGGDTIYGKNRPALEGILDHWLNGDIAALLDPSGEHRLIPGDTVLDDALEDWVSASGDDWSIPS